MRAWAGRNCFWTGLVTIEAATIGANGSYGIGYAWISGSYTRSPMPYLHELAHNLCLGHAGVGTCEGCDWSCTMGLCCRTRCFDAPHSWPLGWALPLADGSALSVSELAPGTSRRAVLPASRLVWQILLIVCTDWVTATSAAAMVATLLFLEYRTREAPHDNDIPLTLEGSPCMLTMGGARSQVWRYGYCCPMLLSNTLPTRMLPTSAMCRHDCIHVYVQGHRGCQFGTQIKTVGRQTCWINAGWEGGGLRCLFAACVF
ncbi:hypothetical protein Vafri_18081 [Volvox africanus]|uniref:Peptidase M11 gametolysin domain-containing protein n=1 Tax=Volvox africanus TaxID=51714 RepID=A0A8J4BRW8_9CHLO|nr:hypothetical protein Vafri_18081 [Volvox africanus]